MQESNLLNIFLDLLELSKQNQEKMLHRGLPMVYHAFIEDCCFIHLGCGRTVGKTTLVKNIIESEILDPLVISSTARSSEYLSSSLHHKYKDNFVDLKFFQDDHLRGKSIKHSIIIDDFELINNNIKSKLKEKLIDYLVPTLHDELSPRYIIFLH